MAVEQLRGHAAAQREGVNAGGQRHGPHGGPAAAGRLVLPQQGGREQQAVPEKLRFGRGLVAQVVADGHPVAVVEVAQVNEPLEEVGLGGGAGGQQRQQRGGGGRGPAQLQAQEVREGVQLVFFQGQIEDFGHGRVILPLQAEEQQPLQQLDAAAGGGVVGHHGVQQRGREGAGGGQQLPGHQKFEQVLVAEAHVARQLAKPVHQALRASLRAWPVPAPAGTGSAGVRWPGLAAGQPPVPATLLDALGRVAWRGAWPAAALAVALPVSGLGPGAYVLRLQPREGPATRRILLE